MLKLRLTEITKTYKVGDTKVEALKNVSLAFRDSEIVSILSPSGCGKTTLLNVIGGLDRCDRGELFISGRSTKKFKDSEWDAYRNRSIGFVFQSYNLIAHQSVLQNVEIAMTLSGVSARKRKHRAIEALEAVGLSDQTHKKPNQLSAGQMQRVAVARALVNNPDVILADEPTGALDSHTSIQLMDILKKISETRLVIMVTHNGKLADEYSSRVIRLLDGEVQSDSNPIKETASLEKHLNEEFSKKYRKTSMSLFTAISLSFRNLQSKKGRTIITSFAGSIGIIGVALVLALSNGLSSYIADMQSDTLSGFPISISTTEQRVDFRDTRLMRSNSNSDAFTEFTDADIIYRYDSRANQRMHTNVLTANYLDYISELETELPSAVNTISYTRGVDINLLAKGEDSVVKFETAAGGSGQMPQMQMPQMQMPGGGNSYWQELPDDDFIRSLYELVGEGSRMPTAKNEVVLVVDEYNRLDEAFFQKIGIFSTAEKYSLTDFIDKTILKVIPNNDFYTFDSDGLFKPTTSADYNHLYHGDSGMELTITGILRMKEGAASSYLSQGIAYTTALTDFIVDDAQRSGIAIAQAAADYDVIQNTPFANDAAREQGLLRVGAITTPTGINIYPKDFAGKDQIKDYLDAYNVAEVDPVDRIIYLDLAEMITSMTRTLLDTVTHVLVGFAAISLVVSTIMIGIITYVSVIERTKEIGILRSVGAKKKDISRVFNAETLIVGFVAGLIGVAISQLLVVPINAVIERLANIQGLANLTVQASLALILGSMILTLIAGFIPARIAARKDPVIALRTE